MTLILTILGGLSFLASILTVAACVLSSRISQEEEGIERHDKAAGNLPKIPVIDAVP